MITTISIAASVITAISITPTTQSARRKKAENVSYRMMAILFAGLGLCTYNGKLKDDTIISVANIFSLILNLILGFFCH